MSTEELEREVLVLFTKVPRLLLIAFYLPGLCVGVECRGNGRVAIKFVSSIIISFNLY